MMQDVLQEAAIGVGVAQRSGGLKLLANPGCGAAIWQRQPRPEFQTWIDRINPVNLPSTRLVLRPQDVVTALSDICDMYLMPQGGHRQHLIEDIAALAHILCDLMAAPYLRLRLERVTSNACRKFHIDAVTARLVCTYRGTGTQYGIATDGTQPKRVFTVPTGAPILLRGSLWPETPHAGVLHRSPPIEGSGQTRLVLVLDPIFDPEDEA